MEGDGRRASSASEEDKLALVKSAAWAWFQHVSAKETRLFDVARYSARAPRSSRFKLEALRAAQADSPSCATSPMARTESSRNSLLDVYEVERIMRQLDLLIEASPSSKVVATKRAGGFWARHVVGICRSVGGVVEAWTLAARRRRGKPPLSAVVV